MFERAVLHLDLDAFFASVEILRDRSLRGKPVIIGGSSGRGVVASCSYEARRWGIRSAMPMSMALRLCPDAVVIRGDMDLYSRQSGLVTEVIASEAPLFEKASIDEFYLDLTGMDKYFGCWKWSNGLREKVMRETGLPISLGLAANKLVSKVSTGEAKPNGARLVERGAEKAFLAPLAVGKLPSVGKETGQKLAMMGVRDVRTLAQIPPGLLAREFGRHGISLWKKANGEDDTPVVPYREASSVSTERTFQEDTVDIVFLRDQLAGMVSRLAYDLRASQKLTTCVTVKIRYTDFNTYTQQQQVSCTAADRLLQVTARGLLDRLFRRRQLVRLIGVKFSGLVQGSPQMNLFEASSAELRLLERMDHLRRRFGDKAVVWGNMIGRE
jgi:DNA polymerase-4